jgi:hypothetical protein
MNYQYANYLMKNYPLTYDDEADLMQYGGNGSNGSNGSNANDDDNEQSKNIPNGGFPPIYFCAGNKTYEDLLKEEKERKLRGYETHKKAVTIKAIMGKRRNVVPFVAV